MRGHESWHHAAASVLVVAVGLGSAAALIWLDLEPAERSSLDRLATEPRVMLVVLFALALAWAVGFLAWRRDNGVARGARRLSESVRLAATRPDHRVDGAGSPLLGELADAVNSLAAAHAGARAELEAKIAEARADVEAERNRFAALISELRSAVLVCNADGQILLYNAAARRLMGGADGELVGLGRSVFGALDRALVVHALAAVERKIDQGNNEPTAQFIAAGSGESRIRISLAPVLEREAGAPPRMGGFVLLCADVTDSIEHGGRRDALLQSVLEEARGALANMRAAVENLIEFPDMEPAGRARFLAAVRDEAVRLSLGLERSTREFSDAIKAEWPLEDMRAGDLIEVARARIANRLSLLTKIESIDEEAWVRVDSFSVVQALTYLAARLREEFAVREVRFRLASAGRHVHLDLLWTGAPLSPETAFAWENDSFHAGGEASPLSLRTVIGRHRGEVWYTRDRPSQTAYYRLVLPAASAPTPTAVEAAQPASAASRPEYYDFDLFRRSESSALLADRSLTDLVYTVFDTETTGLDPSAGDEIISIGAVRIVNGRLLHGEIFESLVASQRRMNPQSIAVHGITSDMLVGQPPIGVVLPRFHRFAADTVLVAHNAAFDLRFLALQEASTGVRFDQPVLDTLLLSAAVHPNQEAHVLEAIAERLGVPVLGRHTSLGDALLTGEVFVRLLPVLAERGIHTLRQAQSVAEKTWHARVRY